MKHNTRFITATFLMIVILTMLFLLFIYPFLSDGYREPNTLETIIIFSVLLLSIEGLICTILKIRRDVKINKLNKLIN